jgi:hypothetical protein
LHISDDLLLASPLLAAQGMAGAAEAAAASGHADLAILVLRSLMARNMPAALAALAGQALATEVLGLWQAAEEAAEEAIRESEAKWPAVQELLVSIATTHQQLQAASTASAAAESAQVWGLLLLKLQALTWHVLGNCKPTYVSKLLG